MEKVNELDFGNEYRFFFERRASLCKKTSSEEIFSVP